MNIEINKSIKLIVLNQMQGRPYPPQDQNAIDAVMQFAIHKLGFLPENILLFGWSIGAYSSLYAATQYPDVKGVVSGFSITSVMNNWTYWTYFKFQILDATFDDVLYLALPRMPQSISNIVRIAIRDYVNLNNNKLMANYDGPALFVRRTEDEIIAE